MSAYYLCFVPSLTSVSAPPKARQSESAPEAERDWEEEQPVDEEAEIERRRRRREEILRKSRASTPMHVLSLKENPESASPGPSHVSTPQKTEINTPRSGKP